MVPTVQQTPKTVKQIAEMAPASRKYVRWKWKKSMLLLKPIFQMISNLAMISFHLPEWPVPRMRYCPRRRRLRRRTRIRPRPRHAGRRGGGSGQKTLGVAGEVDVAIDVLILRG